jgi:DNA-binding CsgD family transcriptional regulator
MAPEPGGLVGREPELAALSRFVHDLSEKPQDLLFEGAPGIGKTILWRAGVEAAQEAGHRVLVSRPGENETGLSYSGIGDLIGDVFDEALAEAPSLQREALEIALLHRETGALRPDQRAISLGVLGAFRTLSASGPVVIAIDDLQWMDGSSARALSFAIRRLEGHPVAVLATTRLERGPSETLDLARELSDRGAVRTHVGPLALDDVARILRERMSRSVTPPLVALVHEAAHGNPFFSLEIVHALRDAEPAAGRPLPVPGDALDILRARIDGLSAGARDVILRMAAMARPTLATLRATSRKPAMVDAGLLEAEEAGLVVAQGERLDFAHPLMRSTAYWSVSTGRRQAIHARIAEVVLDPEERARHMALMGGGPDPERASFVQEAAGHARRRGAPLAAAELWELSADLTPPDDEALLFSRKRSAALERFDAGDVQRGRTMLEDLIGAATSREQQAWTRVELAARSYNDADRVDELVRAALPDVGDHEILLPVAHVNLAWVSLCRLEPLRAVDHARAAAELAERASDPTPLRLALGALAQAEALLGADPWPTIDRAVAIAGDLAPGETTQPTRIRGHQMLWEGRIAEAQRAIAEADLHLVETGLELMRQDTLSVLSEVECAAGEWADAARHADEGYDIIAHAGLDEIRDQMLYARAHVAALEGRIDEARTDASTGASLAAAQGNLWTEVENRSVLGFIGLSVGDLDDVVRALDPADRLLVTNGIVEPGAFPFIPDLAEALVSLGHLDRAKQIVDRLHEHGSNLDRPLALATAARCRALIAAALGDPPGALLELERAFAEHDRVAIPFEYARTLLIHGETLRRMKRKREARESLEGARSRFEALGARLWEARADAALARIGGRSASPTELSETERRVADVVAQGHTNKEAAERLFMSVKTVESNLRRIYRKLGIRSRTELARQHSSSVTQRQAPSRSEHQT